MPFLDRSTKNRPIISSDVAVRSSWLFPDVHIYIYIYVYIQIHGCVSENRVTIHSATLHSEEHNDESSDEPVYPIFRHTHMSKENVVSKFKQTSYFIIFLSIHPFIHPPTHSPTHPYTHYSPTLRRFKLSTVPFSTYVSVQSSTQ